jgi:molecular chaperone GrpE
MGDHEKTGAAAAPAGVVPGDEIGDGAGQRGHETGGDAERHRTAAEMENLRKRTAREREEAIRYANQRLLEELLPVIDNFEMGMLAAAQDTSSMIYIGMDMVRKQLNEFLSNLGVEEIPVTGQFNPNLHDAVSEEPSNTPEGEILRVTRRGYKLRDRLLRPASVVVAAASSLP